MDEVVGVGEEGRDGGSDEDLELGDEWVDEIECDKSTTELFGP